MSSLQPSNAQNRSKRVRVDPTVTTIPEPTSTASATQMKVPKAQALATITTHTATLLPTLSTILLNLGETHLDLLHRRFNKLSQLRRMEPDNTIIPRSARLKFELSVPKSIQELPDFTTLQGLVNSDLETMKQLLRKHVIAALKIESNFYTSKIKEHLCTVLHTTTAAILIANGNSDVNVHRAVASLITAHYAVLFKHAMTSLEEFKQIYTNVHSLTSFPSIATDASATTTLTNNSQYFGTQATQPTPVLEEIPQLDLIYRTICNIFTDPFDS